MSYRVFLLATLITVVCAGPLPAAAQPPPAQAGEVPARTAVSVRGPGGFRWGTPNEFERRSALSMVKLYLADYVVRYGSGSAADRQRAERMIRLSDDAAADAVAAEYPQAVDVIAAEYGLTQTTAAAGWNTATTSTADLADFLAAKQATDPTSPIFGWMASAPPVAADGTQQNWGTARLPGVQGSKWGWSDLPPLEVASASFGPGFTVAAHTRGSPEEQTADVQQALMQVLGRMTGAPAGAGVR